MKKIFAGILCLLLLAAGLAYWYWQNHKKSIVKNLLQNTISDKTDSLYYLHYDSSMIDEINGSAYFRNVYLQSDSEQAALLKHTDSLPNVLINIFIRTIEASGIDMTAYVNDQVVHAKQITITDPRVQIINTGANQLKFEDTLAIYKKIVGEFKSIRADEIKIINATFISKNKAEDIQVKVSHANINLQKFKVDSTRDYSNILSYFIDNIVAEVDSIYLKGQNNNKTYLTRINYNTLKKSLDIDKILSFAANESEASTELKQLKCNKLNISAFVQQHRLQAGNITCAGGRVTVYTGGPTEKTKNIKNKSFEFPEEFFDEVEIGSLTLGNTNLIIRNKLHPEKEPLHVKNLKFSVSNEINVIEGNTFRNIIEKAKWKLSAEGFSLLSEDKIYAIQVNDIAIDRHTQSATIKRFSVKPRITESEFVRQSKKQGDYYNIDISNIQLGGIDINKLLNEALVDVQQASLCLNLKVYNDRMLPVNNDSKVGKYPQQLLLKLKVPLYIRRALIQKSVISYRERALATGQVGNVLFTNVNGVVDNITNIPAYIKINPVLTMNGSGMFLNKGSATTEWKLRLDTNDGAFGITGHIGQMDAAAFNTISVPLGLTSVKGQVKDVSFAMTGNDYSAQGRLTMLYNNLKIESFKVDGARDTLKSKKLENVFSNALIKNDNPANGAARSADFTYKRDLNKSFFNLIWKSLFDGIQKTVMGKGSLQLQKELNKLKTNKKAKNK
ncbi:MAG: hypothetical protein IT257_01425 [Chitinophagaceae bacterium]|nr:hypothetical protein [Chitinophagaceae bacterium]